MAVTAKANGIESVTVTCSIDDSDKIEFHEFDTLDEGYCWIRSTENNFVTVIRLSKKDVKDMCEALLTWANS